MKHNSKTIVITEEKLDELSDYILTESFYPVADVVLMVKDYLDKNFARQLIDDIDENGYPRKNKTVVMLSADKQPLKTMKPSELLLLLDDKFSKKISNKDDRRKFLKQVIKDWYNDKISKTGILSVNYL